MTDQGASGPPFTVVLADDDQRIREALTDLFDDHPRLRVVGSADSGSLAAAICAGLRPHLAVVDVMMPTGGVEAIEAIHRVSPSTIVVAYTARRDRRTRERLLAVGAAAVFTKGGLLDLAAALHQLAAAPPAGDPRSGPSPEIRCDEITSSGPCDCV
jgi:DNA-binding NarL/FixJ family response regulator